MATKHSLSVHAAISVALLSAVVAFGQAPKADKKDGPRVLVVSPLGAAPGVPTRITIRGLKLDTTTGVRFKDSKAVVKVLSKGKAGVPNKQEPARVGDTQVEAEVTLPASTPAGPVTFVVITPSGESQTHQFLVEAEKQLAKEKEPNNGFREAQPIQVPQTVEGSIDRPQDVDVFRFEGKQGERLVAEVLAARYGSALDSILTLSDERGRTLATDDDTEAGADSRLELTLPYTGIYFLTVMDAHDQGGPAHVYRLAVRKGK